MSVILDHTGRPARANALFEGSRQNQRRSSYIQGTFATDVDKSVSDWDHLQMLSMGRFLYSNVGAVKGAVNERAAYSVGQGWVPYFLGKNKRWGDKATEWLRSWFEVSDVKGGPFTFQMQMFLASIHMDRDGDGLMVLTSDQSGRYPMLQFIPAHKIGSRQSDYGGMVNSGPYKGLRISRGVVFNEWGRAVAYRVLGDDETKDNWISARDAHLVYEPEWFEQGRGITALGTSLRDWIDYRDIRDYTKTGIKLDASVGLVEWNESGGLEGGHFSHDSATGVTSETLDGGAIRYYRANSGANIKAFESARPHSNMVNYVDDQLLRGAFQAMGWPVEFTWNPTKLGGANIRMIVEKAQRTIRSRQAKPLMQLYRRAVSYAIAKAVKAGLLPFNPEWYAWGARMPKDMTVDAGYADRSELDQYNAGFTTLSDIYGKRSKDWREEVRQRINESEFIAEECAKAGVDPSTVNPLVTPMEEEEEEEVLEVDSDEEEDQDTENNTDEEENA
jgi:capsid protein